MNRGYTLKDINDIIKVLGPAGKIKVVGKTLVKLPGKCVNKIKDWYKEKVAATEKKVNDLREKLDEYVADEVNTIKENKVQKLQGKIDAAQDVFDTYIDNEAFTTEGTLAYDYLKGVDNRLTKLKNKQAKLSGKKVSFLRTSAIALKKVTTKKIKDIRDKINERKDKKKQEKERERNTLSKLQMALQLLQSKQELEDAQKSINARRSSLDSTISKFEEENQMSLAEFIEQNTQDLDTPLDAPTSSIEETIGEERPPKEPTEEQSIVQLPSELWDREIEYHKAFTSNMGDYVAFLSQYETTPEQYIESNQTNPECDKNVLEKALEIVRQYNQLQAEKEALYGLGKPHENSQRHPSTIEGPLEEEPPVHHR